MNKIKRIALITGGTLCVILGVVGMFMPVLPTTPFLLLAAACFSRSSRRFYDWLLTNRWCGEYIRNYREGRGILRQLKVLTITLLWLTMGATAGFAVSLWWVRLILLGIAAAVTIHLLRIKTFRPVSNVVAAMLLLIAPASAQDELPPLRDQGLMWLVSPLFGYNRDELKQRDRMGQIQTATKTAPEYGLFAMVAHPRYVVNDFLFFTEASGDTEVMGNFFHVNLYGDPDAAVTWNVGGGHLYHKIEPQNEDIEVNVPMAKVGPVLRLKPWGLAFNPYIGYAWERIDTRHGDVDNDSYLYGLSVDWRWRMIGLNAKYYYQDSQELDDDYNNVHLRLTTGFSRHWGFALRFDYMEHATTDDTSVLLGPVYVF